MFTEECKECVYCKSEESNTCDLLRINTDQDVMLSEGKSLFLIKGKPINCFLGTSTFSEYTVLHASPRSTHLRLRTRMPDGDPLLHHLHKLPVADENLTQIFRTLWNSINKGLDFNHKSYIQSLLGLPDIHGVDPVDVERDELRPGLIGTSSDLRVGQSCFTIGNPYGYENTLATGVVSGLGREIPSPMEGRSEEPFKPTSLLTPVLANRSWGASESSAVQSWSTRSR